VTDPSGSTGYSYDARGRVLRKTQTVGSDASAKTFAVAYQYAAGRATGITYPSGRSASYTFDAQGRIAGIAVAGQSVLAGALYLPFGGVTAWTWGNGQIYRRGHDADGRIATVTSGPDTSAYGSETWTFGYDALNRLTSATLPQGDTFGYLYDGDGNRKQETRSGATTNYALGANSSRLQALSGATTKNFSYDAAGNMTGNGSVTFTYDGRGRLSQTTSGHKYSINGLGQRVAKGGPGIATGTVYFVYDEQGHLIGEYDATGAVRQEIVYLGDTPVASVRTNASGGTDTYPIYTDHLDTPRLITNQAKQKVWEWRTDAFGAQAANEDPSGLGVFTFNLRFPGQYYDAETGLHYNYFRDYDRHAARRDDHENLTPNTCDPLLCGNWAACVLLNSADLGCAVGAGLGERRPKRRSVVGI
jgi:YD repeat-containing protein